MTHLRASSLLVALALAGTAGLANAQATGARSNSAAAGGNVPPAGADATGMYGGHRATRDLDATGTQRRSGSTSSSARGDGGNANDSMGTAMPGSAAGRATGGGSGGPGVRAPGSGSSGAPGAGGAVGAPGGGNSGGAAGGGAGGGSL